MSTDALKRCPNPRLEPTRWTPEPPREAGWYWMSDATEAPFFVVVKYFGPWSLNWKAVPKVRYAGPIPEPLED